MPGQSVSLFFSTLFVLLFPSCLTAISWAGVEQPSTVNPLVELALAKDLHRDKYWWTLLHYKRGLFGTRSLVDDPSFFLAPDGMFDPKSELEATIEALFGSEARETYSGACRFIARYAWLREKLGLEDRKPPEEACPEFRAVMEDLRPRAATLIFPTAYINSPASMFGHTLLRIETPYTSKLVSQAVNYAASTDETNGVMFAFKGIFGFYKGYFSVLPYYEKVEEYNDIDQRDIWEYPLNLSEAEVRRMLMHLWELRSTFSHYYFFDENCSYTLLFLLEAARPGLTLTDRFHAWVIPIDTVRAVEAAGLIQGADYRPSRGTRIRHLSSLLDTQSRRLALSVVDGKKEPETVLGGSADVVKSRRILDLAIEYLRYRYAKKKLTKDEYLPSFLRLLNVRNRLRPSGESRDEVPVPADPARSHLSNRMAIGFGTRDFESKYLFQEILYRPAYHDLLDNDEGYSEGSHIEFGNAALRYYVQEDRVVLQYLDGVNITSLSARNDFFKPLSWEVSTGLARQGPSLEEEGTVYRLKAGAGYSYRSPLGGLWYCMAQADVNAGGTLVGDYAAGLGGSLGAVERFGPYKVHLFVTGLYYGFSEFYERIEWGLLQRLKVNTNSNIQVRFAGRRYASEISTEMSLRCNVYF